MKKLFLAALLVAGSFNAFGAACASGSILAQTTAGSCTINGWTLDTWSLGQATQNGYGVNPTSSDILVSFNSGQLGNGTDWFSVSFLNNGLENNGFFTALPGQPNETVNWNTNFSVNGAPIAVVDLSVEGASAAQGGNGQINIQKIVYNPLQPSPTLASNNVIYTGFGNSLNPINIFNNQGNALTRISVADVYQLAAGDLNPGTALDGYTNVFYGVTPQSGVPEPMSFVLMGAGLVGIAALRRRNG